MIRSVIDLGGMHIPLLRVGTAVVGSGCAGWNAVDSLWNYGYRDVALFTEGVNMGTSRNTGSDKQTYYKLSLSGEDGDSVGQMTATLVSGGDVHGDTALCEAAGSVRSFMKLVDIGVPFPTNRFGEYVGYKTDHDPRQRATSAGPLTSRFMTECLEKSVRAKGIEVVDGLTMVEPVVRDGRIYGFFGVEHQRIGDPCFGLCLVEAKYVILATGGPAVCYRDSVYPGSQTGMTGTALRAGVHGSNLQEWQYGLASTAFRWNVSGTYQQVLPRYISVDRNGVEREFLPDYFASPEEALSMVFLKGYQWPFDIQKIHGSSFIDVVVYHEKYVLGRRVFLDFRQDPKGLDAEFRSLDPVTYEYLSQSEALLPTPIRRLQTMNPQAIALYADHGIDLYRDALEIGVCVQHHNGGLWVDSDWQTNIRGLYAVGELAGTFGAYRPGGSALNSTQVGSQRAAEHIAFRQSRDSNIGMDSVIGTQGVDLLSLLQQVSKNPIVPGAQAAFRRKYSGAFSELAAYIRDMDRMEKWDGCLADAEKELSETSVDGPDAWLAWWKNRDMVTAQRALLSAMLLAGKERGSRGSALIRDDGGVAVGADLLRYRPEQDVHGGECVLTRLVDGAWVSDYVPVRDVPECGGWFESVWRDFRGRRGLGLGGSEDQRGEDAGAGAE